MYADMHFLVTAHTSGALDGHVVSMNGARLDDSDEGMAWVTPRTDPIRSDGPSGHHLVHLGASGRADRSIALLGSESHASVESGCQDPWAPSLTGFRARNGSVSLMHRPITSRCREDDLRFVPPSSRRERGCTLLSHARLMPSTALLIGASSRAKPGSLPSRSLAFSLLWKLDVLTSAHSGPWKERPRTTMIPRSLSLSLARSLSLSRSRSLALVFLVPHRITGAPVTA